MPDSVTGTTEPFFDREEIVRRRWQAGLKQSELASLAGITPGTLSRIESGVNGTTPETLGRLARVLGCTVADLARKPARAAS